MDLLADLEARGLVQHTTDRAALAARLAGRDPITLYYGCDPTADSLHHGNLIGLIVLRRFQEAGHVAVALDDHRGRLLRALPSRRHPRQLRAQRWALDEHPAEVGGLGGPSRAATNWRRASAGK